MPITQNLIYPTVQSSMSSIFANPDFKLFDVDYLRIYIYVYNVDIWLLQDTF